MIEIESRELADIPALHAYPVGQKDTPLPCVIFYHGFTSSSLVYSYFAVALAQAGFLHGKAYVAGCCGISDAFRSGNQRRHIQDQ